jgi:hypothetical protein
LPSSAPIGSFHPTRFCPCWAHSARVPLDPLFARRIKPLAPTNKPARGPAGRGLTRQMPLPSSKSERWAQLPLRVIPAPATVSSALRHQTQPGFACVR